MIFQKLFLSLVTNLQDYFLQNYYVCVKRCGRKNAIMSNFGPSNQIKPSADYLHETENSINPFLTKKRNRCRSPFPLTETVILCVCVRVNRSSQRPAGPTLAPVSGPCRVPLWFLLALTLSSLYRAKTWTFLR